MQKYRVLDALSHLAWADDILFDAEKDFLISRLDQAQIPLDQRDRWLESKPDLPTASELREELPDDASRRDFLNQMFRLANIDEEPSEPEWKVLQSFCEALSVPASNWDELNGWLKGG